MTASFDIRNSAFGISLADIGKDDADAFRAVHHPYLRADWNCHSLSYSPSNGPH